MFIRYDDSLEMLLLTNAEYQTDLKTEGGHTIEAFCAGVFLSLYLNAKLKACSDYHTSFWKLMVVLSPIVGAAIIAASVAVDHVSAHLCFSSTLWLCSKSSHSSMNHDAWQVYVR